MSRVFTVFLGLPFTFSPALAQEGSHARSMVIAQGGPSSTLR
jgi:hypothetical protein